MDGIQAFLFLHTPFLPTYYLFVWHTACLPSFSSPVRLGVLLLQAVYEFIPRLFFFSSQFHLSDCDLHRMYDASRLLWLFGFWPGFTLSMLDTYVLFVWLVRLVDKTPIQDF
ncbi:hypothetical protein BDW62DRAFT_114803 [Aspergillus aurantiobrunneus]